MATGSSLRGESRDHIFRVAASGCKRIDGMKRLTPDSTWWHRVPHREITRSVAQGEGGQPWTILASICTRRTARCASWSESADAYCWTRHAPARRPLPPRAREAVRAYRQARAGARVFHHPDDDVPRDGHAVLA